jgi:hypothetical protein
MTKFTLNFLVIIFSTHHVRKNHLSCINIFGGFFTQNVWLHAKDVFGLEKTKRCLFLASLRSVEKFI